MYYMATAHDIVNDGLFKDRLV